MSQKLTIKWDENTMVYIDTHGCLKHYSIEGVDNDGNEYVGTACVLFGDLQEIIDIELK